MMESKNPYWHQGELENWCIRLWKVLWSIGGLGSTEHWWCISLRKIRWSPGVLGSTEHWSVRLLEVSWCVGIGGCSEEKVLKLWRPGIAGSTEHWLVRLWRPGIAGSTEEKVLKLWR